MGTALFLSMGLLTTSSICSNLLAFLSKLIQIIEFSGLMEYYNIDFDDNLGIFLSHLNEVTDFKMMNIPDNSYNHILENSRAGPYKGKLSKTDIPPYFLQDLGYPGIIMMVKTKKN